MGDLPSCCRLVTRAILGASVSLVLITTGCQSISGATTATGVLVRLIDAASSLATYDVFTSQQALAFGVGYYSVTNYAGLGPSSYVVRANIAGTTTQVSAPVTTQFTTGNDYTVMLPFDFPNSQPLILQDETQSAGGYFDIRFINESRIGGSVDLYAVPNGTNLTESKPLIANAPVTYIGTYLSLQPGTYSFQIVPAGTVITPKTPLLFATKNAAFIQGQVRTLVLVDAQLTTSPPVNLLVASDVN